MKIFTLFFVPLSCNSLRTAANKNSCIEKNTATSNSINKGLLLMQLMALVFLLTNGNAWGQVVQTYTTAGSYTWRCPADVTSVTVECWGGGGGSGGCTQTTLSNAGGGGGAGGGYVKRTSYPVTPGTLYTVYVGNGGAAGSSSGGNGGEGEASYFINTSTISAVGGNGGAGRTSLGYGAGGTKKSSGNAGADVGFSFYGGSGGTGNSSSGSGGGGGSAGTGSDGNNASVATGGTAVTGGVAGVNGVTSGFSSGNAGNAGGGGASGAHRTSSGSIAGSAGGRGKVVLTYSYCASAAVSVGQGTWPNSLNDNTSGLGAWSLSSGGGGGHYAASSGSTGMSILNGGSNAWGMYSGGTGGGTNFSNATRTVTMNVGNVISFSMDNNSVSSTGPGSVGISLQNSSGQNLMEFYFRGGATNYEIADNAGSNISTSVPYTTNGLDITITYVSATTYDISITPRNGSTTTMSGRTFSNPAAGRVPGIIRFFSAGAGNGSGFDLYFNSLTISRPIITAHPSTGSQSTCTGSGTSLSVTATGATSYQWFSATDAAVTTSVTNLGSNNGAQTATYTPTSASAGTLYYYCVVTGSCGSTARSNVSGAVTFNAQAVGGTASASSTSLCLNSSTGLSLTGHTGTIQWQRSEDNSSWSNISGATSTSYTTPNLIVTTYYRAALTNGTCTANSNVLTLTVPSAGYVSNASLSTYNSSWSNSQNDNTTGFGAWTLSTSGTAGFFTGSSDINNGGSRSWGLFANNGSVANAVRTASMSIGNTISFSMDNNWIDNSYSVGFNLQNASGENLMGFYFTGGGSNYMISDNAGANSSGVGYTAGGLDVSIAYTGANTYAIYITGKGGTTVSLTGRTFTTQSGGQVPAQIRFYNGGAGSGANYDLFFNSLSISNPVITAHPSTDIQSVCQNTSAIALSLTASGATSYQWFSATNAAGTTGVTNLGSGNGAQTNSYTPSTASVGTLYYYCQVTNSSCGTVTSNLSGAVTVTASNVVSVTIASSDADNIICSGTSVTFTATPANGGTTPAYQWSVNGSPISGQTASTFTSTTIANGDVVSVQMTSNATPCLTGSPATSNSIAMTVSNNNWVGTTGLWSDTANWSCGSVPSNTSIITISSGTPTLDTNFTVGSTGSLTLSGTASLIINSTASLTIAGSANFNGNQVTFKSDASGTAEFGPLTGTLSGATNVTTERYFSARRAFRFTSSAVTTSTTINANWQEGYTTNNQNPSPGFGTHITGAGGSANGFDTTVSNASSLFTFNNSNAVWEAVANTNATILTAGVPYRINVRGDRSINLANPPTTTTATVLRATGTLATGPVTTSSLSSTAGAYNFIGNPYQAPVDIKMVIAGLGSTNISNAFYYVWDPTLNARGAYSTVNLSTTNGTPNVGSANKFLQPGQACFVRTAANGPASITFQESYKDLSGSNISLFRNSNQSTSATSIIKMRLYDSNSLALNQTPLDGSLILFDDSYNNGVDQNDGAKFTNPDEMFSTFNNGALISIEKRMQPTTSDIIPIRISQYRGTNYTIVAEGENLNGIPAYLHDQFSQTYTEIPQSGSVNYPYTIVTSNTQTTATDRFKIVFSNPLLSTANNEWKNFTLYPNPSKQGNFNIILGQPLENGKVIIYNTLGVKVYNQDLENTIENSITPNQSMPTGVYYVEIQNGSERSIKKLIIE